tara:strand:- start:489 stop:674 length:186 start_codon:yes stop_codon:yes gene_type:complete
MAKKFNWIYFTLDGKRYKWVLPYSPSEARKDRVWKSLFPDEQPVFENERYNEKTVLNAGEQ